MSSIYGDTTAIRHLASALREQAVEICATADRLLTESEAVPWQGLAADAMRAGAARQAVDLRRTALLHDEAGAALDRHAAAVDEVEALIAATETRAAHLVSAARDRIAGLLGTAVDPLDDLLDRFVPPPSGSRDWLDVRLPGLETAGPAGDLLDVAA